MEGTRMRYAAGLVLAFTATAALGAERTLDRTFPVKAGGTLTVTADSAGIEVVGVDGNQVVVHMVAEAPQNELDETTFTATPSDSGVTVEMLRPERRRWFDWGRNFDGHIEVKVPRSYRVELKTSGGGIRIESVAGPSRIRTSGGGINAKDIHGALDGSTSGGSIRVESIDGDTRVNTSGGSVYASGVRGSIDANSSGGGVRLMQIDGKINAHTSGGSVECELIGSNRGISASTSGGGIRVTVPADIKGTLDARTSGGDFHTELPISTTHMSDHEMSGLINGGGESIVMRTSGGGITLSAARR
jgi:hypothetical protein